MDIWNKYIENHQERWISELIALLAIPSISTNETAKDDVHRCAALVKHYLLAAGCEFAEVCRTERHPVVFGQHIIDPEKPTVLVYGHYDVQPAEPLELWDSPPFSPLIKDDNIIARGASDDKGQLFMHIKALEMMLATKTLPCNIKFIIEGEEEIGSPSLAAYLEKNKKTLGAEIVIASDTAMISMDQPSIDISLRGMTYMEIEMTGPSRDIHSGVYGGAVANPLNILCKVIASMFDRHNQIAIPGFYDKVKKLSKEERGTINAVPFDLSAYQTDLGIDSIDGEEGFSTLERTGIRPSLDVNGIWGGYMEKGAKTIIPAKANAKISIRLVPDQHPDEIATLFENYIRQITPASVKAKVTYLHGGEPVSLSTDSPAYRAAQEAFLSVFGKEPIPFRSGGSIPVVALFKKILCTDTLLLGFGLDDDRIHSPNEKFGLPNFIKGIKTISYFHKYYASNKKNNKYGFQPTK